jgi:hypothetical protein
VPINWFFTASNKIRHFFIDRFVDGGCCHYYEFDPLAGCCHSISGTRARLPHSPFLSQLYPTLASPPRTRHPSAWLDAVDAVTQPAR